MLSAGQVVDRFTIEALLGEGGMAAVYRVRHNTLGSSHALKLLKIDSEDIRRRLVVEGQIQASLRHPNIVAVTDVIFVGKQPGLLMEMIDGPSLEEWMEHNRLTISEAEDLFRGILAGVARAHRAGLVHRDLKPGNVLLDSADGVVIPKVADFGLAKLMDEGDTSRARTRGGVAIGTPQYMAPEQIRSARDVDQRADIFALGCILYHLVCGRRPFDDPDVVAIYTAIASGRYTAPERWVPDVPRRISAAIAGCLQTDRERRTPDCESLRDLLFPSAPLTGGHMKLTEGRTLDVPRPERPAESRVPSPTEFSVVPPAPSQAPPRTSVVSISLAVFGVGALALALVIGAVGVGWFVTREQAAPVAAPPAPTVGAAPTRAVPVATTPVPAPEIPSPPAAPKVEKKAAAAPRPAAGPPAVPEQPTPPRGGRVVVTGVVEAVRLVGEGGTHAPGSAVPPGSYEVRVTFAGRAEQAVGTATVTVGETTTIACDPAFAMCRIR